MSTKPYARRRRWLGVIILLAVVTALLPAHQASAAGETVRLSREETNNVFYRWLFNRPDVFYKRAIAVEDLVLVGLVLHTPNPESEEAQKQFDAFTKKYYELLGPNGKDADYRASLPWNTVARTMFDAAAQTPGLKDSATKVYRELKAETSSSLSGDTYNAQERVILQSIEQGIASSSGLLNAQLDKATERAKTDKKFAAFWDKVFIQKTEISIEDIDAVTYFADHPSSPIPPVLRDALGPDGVLEISIDQLNQLAKEEFAKINTSIDDMQKTLVTLSKQQGELVDFMRDQQARQKAQAIAEAKVKEHQLKMEAASSAVSIVATIVGTKYPERGKQIAVIGASAIKIWDSYSRWSEAVSGLNTLSKIGSLSTVVMTGNVLGAVMNVVSLFGPQQPPPEQLILEEIGKLRQQVSELRVEMHDRFDQVDKQLNAIYTSMNERFNQIDIQLGKINGSIEELQQSLYTLSLALDRLERNNTEYLDALGRRPLREAMNGGLGYEQRTGVDMPYQPEFVDYENAFHTWGTITAFDPLSAGPTQRDYSDGQVLAELSAAPLDANLNYLNGWLVAHGMQPFTNKRLPSPRDWAFASRAYAALGLDWPEHLKRISPERQAALDAVGKDLQQALENIATIQTPSGPQGNGPLFTALTDYYTSKLQGLDVALQGSEATFVADVQNNLQRATPIDLYGGLDQPLNYQPTDFTTMNCDGRGEPRSHLPTPRHLKNIIADYNRFALADYLGVSPMKVCLFAEWTKVDPECPPATCNRYGDYRVFMIVYSDNMQLVRRELTDRELYEPDVWAKVQPEWERYWKKQFEAMFGNTPTPPPLSPEAAKQLEAVNGKLVSKLAELQRAHASRVLTEQTRGQLQARGVELAGAKKLLESFVTLGLPRALGSDDLLRSLLLSDEAIIDNQQIGLSYTAALSPTLSATQTISEARLLVNPRVELRELGEKRRDALSSLLSDYLGNLSTQAYREDNALIAGTRFDMFMARVVADPNAPLPGQEWTVFLPLIQHQ